MSVGRFAFLPNLRSAAAAEAARDGVRLRLEYDLEITGDGAAQGDRVPVGAELKGPGDVIGLDAGQITRIEPEEANRGFEPNYFPFIEFRDPDLPWRYSLETGTADRLRPWFVLIALKGEEFTFLDQGSALAPRIEVASIRDSLPDLNQAWASAMVQVDMDGTSGDPALALLSDPGRGFSRIYAHRKLEADTQYTLFLVPSTRAGRDAALTGSVGAGVGNDLAWEHGASAALILPYYFRHTFRTDPGQDLEQLLRKLRAIRADEADEAGAPLWVSAEDIGYYQGFVSRQYGFEAQAGLAQPGAETPKYDTPRPLELKLVRTLNKVLSEEPDDEDADPLLTFPAHGAHYSEAKRMRADRAREGHWFHRSNLDLRFRAAAGLGRRIVKENDAYFARLCWDQYDEITAANQALRQLQIATLLAGKLDQRHFSRLDSETGLQLAEPLQGFTRVDPDDAGAPSIRRQLKRKRLPEAYAGLGLRRVAARKPVQDGKAGVRRMALGAMPGDRTPSRPAGPEAPGALARRRQFLAGGKDRAAVEAAMGTMFNVEYLGRKPRPRVPQARVGEYSSKEMHVALAEKLKALPKQKADHLISGRSKAEAEAGGIIWRAPRVPDPLVDYLIRISRDSLLSNFQSLPDNTVSLYEENRAFVEALMLGANTAMNEELRWREYPTDMRGTIFHRFWNRGADPDDLAADDILDIRQWSGRLGRQDNPADADGKANLVVVIKGEVVRKLRDPMVVISIANGGAWDPQTATDHNPVFFGKLGRDAVYYGFDISRDYLLTPAIRDRAYFAIYEPPGRLRFGLDVGNMAIRRSRRGTPDAIRLLDAPDLDSWDDLSWAHMRLTDAGYIDFSRQLPEPAQGGGDLWSETKHAAGLARSFWQKPLAALLPVGRVL